jgi:arginyl-tRNA synthetase
MKSREGTVVDADRFLDELRAMAAAEVRARHDFLDEATVDRRAEAIALAAVKFFLLAAHPAKDIIYDPKASLSFTGRTGPYLQYTYARAQSILRKARGTREAARGARYDFSEPQERTLLLHLMKYPEAVAVSAAGDDPSHLGQYSYELAKQFADFYEAVPVLAAPPGARAVRLALVAATASLLGRALTILGIPLLDEM